MNRYRIPLIGDKQEIIQTFLNLGYLLLSGRYKTYEECSAIVGRYSIRSWNWIMVGGHECRRYSFGRMDDMFYSEWQLITLKDFIEKEHPEYTKVL
jgi:hypothetical protein